MKKTNLLVITTVFCLLCLSGCAESDQQKQVPAKQNTTTQNSSENSKEVNTTNQQSTLTVEPTLNSQTQQGLNTNNVQATSEQLPIVPESGFGDSAYKATTVTNDDQTNFTAAMKALDTELCKKIVNENTKSDCLSQIELLQKGKAQLEKKEE